MVTSLAGRARAVIATLLGLLLAAACGSSDDSDLWGGGDAAGGSPGDGRAGRGGTSSGGSAGHDGGGSAGRDSSTVCSTDADCSSGVCDPLSKLCVACLFDADCETNQRCTDKQCEPVVPCTNSLDCVGAANKPVCDPARRRCEECLQAADCTGKADCIDNRCRPYTPCTNSLDCGTSGVCDTSNSRCVGCLTNADCGSGKKCVNKSCVEQVACQSDTQCTPLGLLCDTARGICVRCTRHQDCPEIYHCSDGDCVLDVCRQDEARCQGNAIVRCNPVGDALQAATPCAAKQSCVVQGATATCKDWVCDAGLKYCLNTEAIECSADGFQILSRTNCAQSGLVCSAGTCRTQLCTANQLFCDGLVVKRCDATGQNATVVDTCTSGEFCDTAAPSCKPQLCVPNQPACNQEVATTCNATGSGYNSGGTNCAGLGQSCAGGVCQNCPAGNGAARSVRMVEIFIGGADYAVLENRHASCPAELGGMQLRAHINSGGADDLDFTLPSRSLAPGARVFVAEAAAAQAGDITTSGNIAWSGTTTGGYALLCTGPCATTPTSNVIDALSFNAGQVPPAFPSPVVFSPGPMTGLTTNENTQAFKRTAFGGAYPTFLASDWTVGAASRPYTAAGCPATQPVNGSTCSALGTTCNYGAVSCYCLLTWSCS